ncbi:MAG: hypothetical protein MJK04_17445 [Psychrosphaera sp.]|nr:hypothetical protein [Psychrosphaera sp.]
MLYNHPTVDIDRYIREPGNGTITAVATMLDGISYHYLEDNLQCSLQDKRFTKMHQQLAATFPDHGITIAANSVEDNEIIVKIRSDKNPGEFYLFNQQKHTISYLLRSK